jgi:hypothetical protein
MNPLYLIRAFCLIFTAVTSAHAEEAPFSPAFVLQAGQWLSISDVAYTKSDFEPSTTITGFGTIKGSLEASGLLVRQTVRYGITKQLEVGVSEHYSDVDADKAARIKFLDGFSNPTFSLRHTWHPTALVKLQLDGSIRPKTSDHGLRGQAAAYSLGGRGVFITPNGLTTHLGFMRTMIDGDEANVSRISVGAYKAIGIYSIELSGSIQQFDSASTRQFLEQDSIRTLRAAVGRKLSDQIWVQLFYQYAVGDYQPREIAPGINIGMSYDTTMAGASLNLLF